MLAGLFISFSVAALLTSAFTFRFRMWDRPRVVVGYFLTFLVLKGGADYFFLPPGALSVEMGFLSLLLAVIFVGATFLAKRYEDGLDAER